MNTPIVIESLTIVYLLNKVQFPFVKVFPPQMLSSSSEGAIVQAVPIAFAPVLLILKISFFTLFGCGVKKTPDYSYIWVQNQYFPRY